MAHTDHFGPIDVQLLQEVLGKRRPDLAHLVHYPDIRLTAEEREILRETIAAEFVETGLGPGDEPNSRGIQLERIIDLFGRDTGTRGRTRA